MYRNRLGEAAYPTHLDVEDAARLHVDGSQRVPPVADRLVQADCRLQPLLQHRVEVEIVVPQWLLDHQQLEPVPLRDVVYVGDAIGRVGIATQQYLRPARAHSLEDFSVPARLALQLDALIARLKLLCDRLQQRRGRRLNSDRDAARNHAARSTQQPCQWHPLLLRLQLPHRVLQRRLGHPVPAHLSEELGTASPADDLLAHQTRRKLLLGDDPCRVDALVGEVRMFTRHALAPSRQPAGLDLHQQNAARCGEAKARLKRKGEWHVDLA